MERATRLAAAGAFLVVLVSCGSGTAPESASTTASAMPGVTGLRLDIALSDIKRAGFVSEVEVLGGGTFGVVVESNWLVCEQVPMAGETLTSPRLTVGRECPNLDPAPTSADPAVGVAPTTFPQSSVPSVTESQVPAPDTVPVVPSPTMALIPALPTSPPANVAPTPTLVDFYFANCAEAEAAGMAPLLRGQPGYRRGLDRDHDGIACDQTG